MLTMKRVVGPLSLAVAGLMMVGAQVNAATTSDQPAAVLIYPKIIFNTEPVLTDTIIEVANASNQPVDLHCFYVNATSHCTNTGLACTSGLDCIGTAALGACVPGWGEQDFHVVVTPNQPLYWTASAGRNRSCANATPPTCEGLPLSGLGVCDGGTPLCVSDADCGTGGHCNHLGGSNAGTSIPPVPEDVLFVGELKCVAVNELGLPRLANFVYGTATLVSTSGGPVDAQSYNAVGIKARGFCDGFGNGPFCDSDADCDPGVPCIAEPDIFIDSDILQMGSIDDQTPFQGCAETLILDHVFDGAPDPIVPDPGNPLSGGIFVTDLTLVPCTEDFATGTANLGRSTAQFLVFNEFEQRFSTTEQVTCFDETLLSNLDTTDNVRSIFSINVSGTIAGQSRINAVGSGLVGVARTMKPEPADLAFIRDFQRGPGLPPVFGFGAAYELHQQGQRDSIDEIVLP